MVATCRVSGRSPPWRSDVRTAPDRRRREILDRVRAAGAVRPADPAREPQASDMTVRRDPERLVRDGEVHGEAGLPAGSPAAEPGSPLRSGPLPPEQAATAAAAGAMVHPGMSVPLNSGTTTCAPARRLRGTSGITVVTDSTEWGPAGLHRIAGLDEADPVVMDDGVGAAARAALRRSVPDPRLEHVR